MAKQHGGGIAVMVDDRLIHVVWLRKFPSYEAALDYAKKQVALWAASDQFIGRRLWVKEPE